MTEHLNLREGPPQAEHCCVRIGDLFAHRSSGRLLRVVRLDRRQVTWAPDWPCSETWIYAVCRLVNPPTRRKIHRYTTIRAKRLHAAREFSVLERGASA